MKDTAIFTVKKSGNCCSIESKKYNTYNRLNVPCGKLFENMAELADIFNNVLELAILFEVD